MKPAGFPWTLEIRQEVIVLEGKKSKRASYAWNLFWTATGGSPRCVRSLLSLRAIGWGPPPGGVSTSDQASRRVSTLFLLFRFFICTWFPVVLLWVCSSYVVWANAKPCAVCRVRHVWVGYISHVLHHVMGELRTINSVIWCVVVGSTTVIVCIRVLDSFLSMISPIATQI